MLLNDIQFQFWGYFVIESRDLCLPGALKLWCCPLTRSLSVHPDCCLLSLVTVDLFRKYIFFLDLPLSWLLTSSLCCTISCQGYMQAKVRRFAARNMFFNRCRIVAVQQRQGYIESVSQGFIECSGYTGQVHTVYTHMFIGFALYYLRVSPFVFQAAMLCHRSQLLWFRYLYVTFSRYMFTNTFRIIPHGPKDFKIY